MRTALRRAVRVAAAVVAVLLLPAVGAAISAPATFAAHYSPGPERPFPAAVPGPHDPTKPTAVVVVGGNGAEVADVLAPYGVIASTGRFNVYTVAPQRRPVPLTGGLDLVPDLTFDDLAARVGAARTWWWCRRCPMSPSPARPPSPTGSARRTPAARC